MSIGTIMNLGKAAAGAITKGMGTKATAAVASSAYSGVTRAGIALDAITTGIGVGSRMSDGDSLGKALMKEVPTAAFLAMVPGGKAYMIYQAAMAGFDMYLEQSKMNVEQVKQIKNTGSGYVGSGSFNMSEAGYTMRQRAVQKMQATGINLNSVLGNEARTYTGSSRARGAVI